MDNVEPTISDIILQMQMGCVPPHRNDEELLRYYAEKLGKAYDNLIWAQSTTMARIVGETCPLCQKRKENAPDAKITADGCKAAGDIKKFLEMNGYFKRQETNKRGGFTERTEVSEISPASFDGLANRSAV